MAIKNGRANRHTDLFDNLNYIFYYFSMHREPAPAPPELPPAETTDLLGSFAVRWVHKMANTVTVMAGIEIGSYALNGYPLPLSFAAFLAIVATNITS